MVRVSRRDVDFYGGGWRLLYIHQAKYAMLHMASQIALVAPELVVPSIVDRIDCFYLPLRRFYSSHLNI